MTRIVAGRLGGRRLRTPPGDTTRPTSERVREALFSTLSVWAGTAASPAAQSLAGLAFCDLFAGSGAVAFEAASRGADSVLLVESSSGAAVVARNNARTLGITVTVRVERVERVIGTPAARAFDVVFADPPYAWADGPIDELLANLVRHRWIAPGGMVVVERSTRSAPPHWPDGFDRGWARRYGETTLYFGCGDAEAADKAGEGEGT